MLPDWTYAYRVKPSYGIFIKRIDHYAAALMVLTIIILDGNNIPMKLFCRRWGLQAVGITKCQINWDTLWRTTTKLVCPMGSVTRLGDLLHSGKLFKACGNNYFAQIAHILGNFVKVLKSFIFIVKLFSANFYRHLAIFSGHTANGLI